MVISDAGPLMALAKLNLLHLLQQCYGRVYFSPAVYKECVTEGIRLGYQDAHVLHRFLELQGWHTLESVHVLPEIMTLPLDLGERESIALAIQHRADLLMDEERGRSVARQFGLKVRGTLGLLIHAHREGHIGDEQLRFYFGQIAERTDIWISPSLCANLLQQVLGTPKDS